MGGAVEAGKLCHLVDFQPEVVQVLLRLFNPGVVCSVGIGSSSI